MVPETGGWGFGPLSESSPRGRGVFTPSTLCFRDNHLAWLVSVEPMSRDSLEMKKKQGTRYIIARAFASGEE